MTFIFSERFGLSGYRSLTYGVSSKCGTYLIRNLTLWLDIQVNSFAYRARLKHFIWIRKMGVKFSPRVRHSCLKNIRSSVENECCYPYNISFRNKIFIAWKRHGPLTKYVKLRAVHAPGMPGTFSPSPTSRQTAGKRSWHASRHVRHARAVMHVGIVNPRWQGNRCMRNPKFYVSGKRPMGLLTLVFCCTRPRLPSIQYRKWPSRKRVIRITTMTILYHILLVARETTGLKYDTLIGNCWSCAVAHE